MKGGRPLRFLGLTIGGWITLRVVALWPSAEPLREAARHLGLQGAEATVPLLAGSVPWPTATSPTMPHPRSAEAKPTRIVMNNDPRPANAAVSMSPGTSRTADITVTRGSPPPFVPPPQPLAPRRFAGSAWLIARGGANAALLGGQLGASQGGVRVTYTLDRTDRLALAARLAAPLHGRGREAAVGLDWQPTAAPVHIIVEQRFFLDGGLGGPSASIVGGVGPRPIAGGIQVEAYGQAGGIARGRIDGFADGMVRTTYPVATMGKARVDLGLGAWGGAQRGASRLDAGPSIAVALPVAGRTIRVTADWRERIAGHARPGSGPALSVGSDF